MISDKEYGDESYATVSSSSWVPNPTGKNQYSECPPPNNLKVAKILSEYDHKGSKHPSRVSRMLRSEHGITRQTFNLKSSHQTTQELPELQKRQLVLDQLSKDPLMRKIPNLIKEAIRLKTGYDLTRQEHLHSDGF
ncbi:hypothetical protein M422DRAFT_161903 [Sphaerobolus stellatus SS14]|nr:hypothetical protein M422DRAFT_161903 [Sphaerobolus stellatus SS14]